MLTEPRRDESFQAWILGRMLTRRTDVEVELVYRGPGRSWRNGWHVRWSNGPTELSMRRFSSDLVARSSAIDLGTLRHDRTPRGAAAAAAWLTWLSALPEAAAPQLGRFLHTTEDAFDCTEYPEFTDPVTARRAEVLASLPTSDLSGFGIPEAAVAAARNGVPALLALLDQRSDQRTTERPAAAPAIDLATERARRRARRYDRPSLVRV
ncbi:hypothetical protein [Microlunatus parietis]|uniref:Uncharacterized protein n=2 Tax=Microlunatus parietis TaxID=682979 RepID=A0A7Y9I369_9ACTN|nr:hypothetical protein [Microlunatus parietis]